MNIKKAKALRKETKFHPAANRSYAQLLSKTGEQTQTVVATPGSPRALYQAAKKAKSA